MLKKKIYKFLSKNIKIKSFYSLKNKSNKLFVLKYKNQKKTTNKLYLINDARIVQLGNTNLAILHKNFLINELSFQSNNLVRKNIQSNKVFKKGYLSFFSKKINGTSVSLLQDISTKKNYFHFLFDSISRLFWVEKKKIKFDTLLVPSLNFNFQKEIVSSLKLKCNVINCEKINILDTKKLVVIDHPYWKMNNLWKNDISNIPEWSVKYLRKKFISLKSNKNFKKNFFIDRSFNQSPHNQIKNIIEVKKLLIKYNFLIINLSKLSFKEQISLFKNAKIIVSPHDAGLANLTFCSPNTKILEFRQKKHFVRIEKISKINKLIHKIWLSPIDKNNRMVIDLKKLETYLRKSKINN